MELIWTETNPKRGVLLEKYYLMIDFGFLVLEGVLINDWFLTLHHKTLVKLQYLVEISFRVALEYVSLLIHSFYKDFFSDIQKIILYNENAFVQCPSHKLLFFFLLSTRRHYHFQLDMQNYLFDLLSFFLWFRKSMHSKNLHCISLFW